MFAEFKSCLLTDRIDDYLLYSLESNAGIVASSPPLASLFACSLCELGISEVERSWRIKAWSFVKGLTTSPLRYHSFLRNSTHHSKDFVVLHGVLLILIHFFGPFFFGPRQSRHLVVDNYIYRQLNVVDN